MELSSEAEQSQNSVPESNSDSLADDNGDEEDLPAKLEDFYRSRSVPGAILPEKNIKFEDDFRWLDAVDQADCFMPFELSDSRPFKTLDFGDSGFTASITSSHQLLQLTAPDRHCSLVFVRGDYPDSPESILARAQRRDQKGTFGLDVQLNDEDEKGAQWVSELTPAQGLINFRWPCTQFRWIRQTPSGGGGTAREKSVVCTMCSFVKDGTLYQISRLVPERQIQAPPVSMSNTEMNTPAGAEAEHTLPVAGIKLGGIMRFGCPRTASSNRRSPTSTSTCTSIPRVSSATPPPFLDQYACHPEDGDTDYTWSASSFRHRKRVALRLWVNRVPSKLGLAFPDYRDRPAPRELAPRGWSDVFPLLIRQKIPLALDTPTVIVASFSVVEDDGEWSPTEEPLPPIADAEVQLYLGAAHSSLSAPARLWSSLIGPATPNGSQFEMNVIARSVESVLGVTSLPVGSATTRDVHVQQDHQAGDTSNAATSTHARGIALLKNIMTPQTVDLESVFWQVRLLVRAAAFLQKPPAWFSDQRRAAGPALQQYKVMQDRYCRHILNRIVGVCTWVMSMAGALRRFSQESRAGGHAEGSSLRVGLLATDAMVGDVNEDDDFTAGCCGPRDRDERVPPHLGDQKYFCAVILWYVCRNLPEMFGHAFFGTSREPLLEQSIDDLVALNPVPSLWTLPDDDPKRYIIRWYHIVSVLGIRNKLQHPSRVQGNNSCENKTPVTEADDLRWAWQMQAEKFMKLLEQRRVKGGAAEHETALLASLGSELGIIDKGATVLGKSCYQLAKQMIQRRRPTDRLSPSSSSSAAVHVPVGPRYRTDLEVWASSSPQQAPWELSCLAHFVPDALGLVSTETRRSNNLLGVLQEFTFCDNTFMKSWDESDPATVAGWWDHKACSIICARFLENLNYTCTMQAEQTTPEEKEEQQHEEPERVELMKMIYKQLQTCATCKSEILTEILDWKKHKPGKLYHCEAEIQSLEDTPETARADQHRSVELRKNVYRYLAWNQILKPNFSLASISHDCPAKRIHSISCFDMALIKANDDDNNKPAILCGPIVTGRASEAFWTEWSREDGKRGELLDLLRRNNALDMYLIGELKPHSDLATINPFIRDESVREDLLCRIQDSLFRVLNDSLVDQGIKYRFIFSKHLTPPALKAMVYIWHPDALDTFDDHLGELSSFRNLTSQSFTGSSETWITSITLKHWQLLSDEEIRLRRAERGIDEMERAIRAMRAAAPRGDWDDFPPRWVTDKGKNVKVKPGPFSIYFPEDTAREGRFQALWQYTERGLERLRKVYSLSLSLAITGDERGRSWTCSVICELFDEADMARYTTEAMGILQLFLHQQHTGRCLVFLLFLGYMCDRMAEECDRFTVELRALVNLSPKAMLESMKWVHSNQAVSQLEQMLWGFETLRLLGDNLSRVTVAVDSAALAMRDSLSTGSALRHKVMDAYVLKVQEDFNKRYSRLTTIYNYIQQQVDQGTKLRDGISSVVSVRQNEIMSTLTWTTILYLGPALVVGLFGMEHGIIPDDNGTHEFLSIMAYLLFGTFIFVESLPLIREVYGFLFGVIHVFADMAGVYCARWVQGKIDGFRNMNQSRSKKTGDEEEAEGDVEG